MPIPVFVAGLAVGAGLVVAYNNKDKIKESIVSGVEKGKDLASDAKEKVCKSKKGECSEVKEIECKEAEAKTECKEEPKAETKAESAKAEPKSTAKKEAK